MYKQLIFAQGVPNCMCSKVTSNRQEFGCFEVDTITSKGYQGVVILDECISKFKWTFLCNIKHKITVNKLNFRLGGFVKNLSGVFRDDEYEGLSIGNGTLMS